MADYAEFLNEKGKIIFDSIKENCLKLGLWDADDFEIAMLANSFALYAECADYCNRWGVSMQFKQSKKGANMDDEDDLAVDEQEASGKPQAGIYQQGLPEYTVMKNEYGNILKHSGKFGLNPGDRARLFKKLSEGGKEKKKFGKEAKMKVG
jgi:hypothetical protein